MHWETQKNSVDSLYHDICFIAVVWNPIHNISKDAVQNSCLSIHQLMDN